MAYVTNIKRIIEETTPFLLILTVIVLLSGGILSGVTEEFKIVPGLLILLPPLLDLRGNIGASLASRLSSAFHLGYMKPNKVTNCLKSNVYAAIFLSIVISFLLGLFSWLTCILLGTACISITTFVTISMITGIVSSSILTLLTILITQISFRRGLDPDNITAPSIGSIGDIVTIICFVLTIKLVLVWGMI